jgi:hypothetical protein
MNEKRTSEEEIISMAKNTKYYCELLIKQSENWQPFEDENAKRKINHYTNYSK